jgi:hypothetical protein
MSSMTCWKLPWKILSKRLKPPWAAKAPVEILAVHEGLGNELLFDALQPLVPNRDPFMHAIDATHYII